MMRNYRRYPRRKIIRKRRVVRRRPVIRRRRAVVRNRLPAPEVKTAILASSVTSFNQAITGSDCLNIIPSISQGTTGITRIGDKINLRSLHVRGVITLDNGDYSTISNLRLGVRVMIVRSKRYTDWNQLQSNFGVDYTKLLEGTTNGFQGYLYDFTTPVNKDFFSVISDRKYYLSRGQQIGTNSYANGLDKSFAFFNIKLPYHRRKLIYDSQTNSSTYPINYPYAMLLGVVKLDGSSPDGSLTLPVEMQYTCTAKFTDY